MRAIESAEPPAPFTARAGAVTLPDRHALPEVIRVLAPLAGH